MPDTVPSFMIANSMLTVPLLLTGGNTVTGISEYHWLVVARVSIEILSKDSTDDFKLLGNLARVMFVAIRDDDKVGTAHFDPWLRGCPGQCADAQENATSGKL
jgi:hypothetical protein